MNNKNYYESPAYLDELRYSLQEALEVGDYDLADELQVELQARQAPYGESLESLLDAVCVDVPEVPDDLAALCMAQAAGVVA